MSKIQKGKTERERTDVICSEGEQGYRLGDDICCTGEVTTSSTTYNVCLSMQIVCDHLGSLADFKISGASSQILTEGKAQECGVSRGTFVEE